MCLFLIQSIMILDYYRIHLKQVLILLFEGNWVAYTHPSLINFPSHPTQEFNPSNIKYHFAYLLHTVVVIMHFVFKIKLFLLFFRTCYLRITLKMLN